MLLSIVLLCFIVVVVVFQVLKLVKLHVDRYLQLRKLPGPPQTGFVWGNMSDFATTPEKLFQLVRQITRKYYPIFEVHASHVILANVVSPEDCELILSNSAHNSKGALYELYHNWLREGIFTGHGPKILYRRKLIIPAFNVNMLQYYVPVFVNQGKELVSEINKERTKSSAVNISPIGSYFALKAVAEASMSTKLTFENQEEIDYENAVYSMLKIFVYKVFHPWFLTKFLNIFSPLFSEERRLMKILNNFNKEIIKNRKIKLAENNNNSNTKSLPVLDLLISAQEKGLIDEEGVFEEVATLMFGGHDTVQAAFGFIFMLIASHKDIQERIVDEMYQILEDLDSEPTYIDLQNLKYMECCIKEALRLYPSAHFIARELGEDLETHTGYLLPKGTNVILHIYDIHRNPDIYPDPEKFEPDRFLPENCKNRHAFAYLPFSAGPRSCVGQKFAILELKAAVCAVLSNFILEPVDTPETIELVFDVILKAKEGIKVRFIPRT